MSTFTGRLGFLSTLAAGMAALMPGQHAAASYQDLNRRDKRRARFGKKRFRSRRLARLAQKNRTAMPGSPFVIAIRRVAGGKRAYARCVTRDQALAHRPYLIEHINGWGQVTRRERLGRDF